MPHARVEGVEQIAVLIGRLPIPLNWLAIDGEPVRSVCLLLAPPPRPGVGVYLPILERIVRRFRDQSSE